MRNSFELSSNSDLTSAYAIDQLLLDEKNKIIGLEFKRKEQSNFKLFNNYDGFLDKKFQKNFLFFSAQIETVFDFIQMYEIIFFPTNIFFYKNKKILVDIGSGNNNKIEKPFFLYKQFFLLLKKIFFGIKKGKTFISSRLS